MSTTTLLTPPAIHSARRWLRFNLVGAIGMALQIAALALLNASAPSHPLLASSIALELTLLHNFAWHQHYTWRDRSHASSTVTRLLRFHLANGLVSWVGNLALLPLLLRTTHLRLLPANLLVIAICSIANFSLGDRFTFPAANQSAAP
jgi:putative flippase GtrA